MRFVSLAVLGLIVLAGPAWGQQSNGTIHNFGSSTCRPRVPCPDSSTYISSTDLNTVASACVTESFGYPNTGSGFFSETTPLNSKDCLTAKPDILPKGMGSQLFPACCIIKLPDNTCSFHCELLSGR